MAMGSTAAAGAAARLQLARSFPCLLQWLWVLWGSMRHLLLRVLLSVLLPWCISQLCKHPKGLHSCCSCSLGLVIPGMTPMLTALANMPTTVLAAVLQGRVGLQQLHHISVRQCLLAWVCTACAAQVLVGALLL